MDWRLSRSPLMPPLRRRLTISFAPRLAFYASVCSDFMQCGSTAHQYRPVPTRSTGYTHLRDGFVRAIQARLAAAKAAGQVSPAEEVAAQSPIRQLKTLFPNTPLTKGTPLDIILTEPEPMSTKRALIFRDLGVVYDDWVTREFVLAYFEGKGISPPVRRFYPSRGNIAE
jgi:hypothetical protein